MRGGSQRFDQCPKFRTVFVFDGFPKWIQRKIESDHNILYAKFKLVVQGDQKKERIEVFNFNNPESQRQFLEETSEYEVFDQIFSSDCSIEEEENQRNLFRN